MSSWNIPNKGAENSYGFTVKGAGKYDLLMGYDEIPDWLGYESYFWTSSSDSTTIGGDHIPAAWQWGFSNTAEGIWSFAFPIELGLSLRCLKNPDTE